MADVSKLRLDGTTYDVKDENARKYLVMVDEQPQPATKVVIETIDETYDLAFQSDVDSLEDVIERQKYFITPQMFGAKGDGETDDRAALQEFFSHVDTDQATGYIPEGVYLASDTIGNTSMTHGIHIIAHPKAVLKAAVGFSGTRFVWFAESPTASDIYFHWDGGVIVSENVPLSQSGQANDGLTVGASSTHPIITCVIENLTITPLESLLTTGPSLNDITSGRSHSDSCLMLTSSHSRVYNCKFYYAVDCGIYLSGGGDTLDYIDCVVDSCMFYGCSSAMTSKRQFRGVKFINNTVMHGDWGFADAYVGGSQTYIGVGSDTLVANNDFSYLDAAVGIRLQESAVVNGNRFTHCGICVYVQGSVGTSITGNSFDLTDSSASTLQAVSIRGYNDTNNVTVNCNGTTICGNTYRSVADGPNTIGIHVDDVNQKNIVIEAETMYEVTSPIDNPYNVDGTICAYKAVDGVGTQIQYTYRGGVRVLRRGYIPAGSSVTLYFASDSFMDAVMIGRADQNIHGIIMVDYWGTTASIIDNLGSNITVTKASGVRYYTIQNNNTFSVGFMQL